MNFVVGQDVVCINDNWLSDMNTGALVEKDPSAILPVLNGVYRIIGINAHGNLQFQGMRYRDYTVAFDAEQFRPVVKRKTDISIFTRLLVPGTKILEDA